MGTIFYSIDDDNHSYPLETNWDIHEDGEYAAQDAAEDYHSNHDGWEASWPVDVSLRETKDGPVIATYQVEREYEPQFSATLRA